MRTTAVPAASAADSDASTPGWSPLLRQRSLARLAQIAQSTDKKAIQALSEGINMHQGAKVVSIARATGGRELPEDSPVIAAIQQVARTNAASEVVRRGGVEIVSEVKPNGDVVQHINVNGPVTAEGALEIGRALEHAAARVKAESAIAAATGASASR